MILITGGAGYIGSHTCVEMLNEGEELVVIDNFSNSKPTVLDRIKKISGKDIVFHEGDICDEAFLNDIFERYDIESVVHFAGLKAVGESVEIPLKYYENNVAGTITLINVMAKHDVKRIVFSSSATVYGDPEIVPIPETSKLHTTNPYGQTKLMIENMLRDLYVSDNEWRIVLLRYFNPIGAHKSGLIGEDPSDIPNNLMPYITQVAIGKREKLNVFGNDYPTPDGTGVRDYIHVVDLSQGHVKAIKYIRENAGIEAVNLGTGKGYSVLDVVKAFEKASGVKIPYEICDRRAGDIATCYADPSKAKKIFGWQTMRSIEAMCEDSWNWQSKNPRGYAD